jgi:hypothetical protein
MPNPTGKGGFRKGPDPRRHELTLEERQRGYSNAIRFASVDRRAWIRARVAGTASPARAAVFQSKWANTPKDPNFKGW